MQFNITSQSNPYHCQVQCAWHITRQYFQAISLWEGKFVFEYFFFRFEILWICGRIQCMHSYLQMISITK